jgi:hypothetical protein
VLEYINTHMLIKSQLSARTHFNKCGVLDAMKIKTDDVISQGNCYLRYKCVDMHVCVFFSLSLSLIPLN